jgi:hypothetical protein
LIPDGVIGIFHRHNLSSRTMALGSTQSLTEMSTRNIFWSKGGRCIGLTTLPPSCVDYFKIWEPQPPGTLRACSRPVMGLLGLSASDSLPLVICAAVRSRQQAKLSCQHADVRVVQLEVWQGESDRAVCDSAGSHPVPSRPSGKGRFETR